MSDIVIEVKGLSKQYRLGQIGTGSLAHDINRFWYRVRGKEDPYLKIGEENDRTKTGSSEYVWALHDISFEMNRGDILGVIGKNGAGKSTLLKILSRTTAPTKGIARAKGRIASLLEVGTGFHPELSGRENIFLNGAILGMTKSEIRKKFDEIVDFAGVERYVDTPVKRYSSGMYVRLAFAIAAHLEPEILIVDEVLAVGDAEFQRKCLGKIKDVSTNEGRTVLFVSHSMTSVQALCTKGIFLSKGKTNGIEKVNVCVEKYLYGVEQQIHLGEYNGESAIYHSDMRNQVKVLRVQLLNDKGELCNRFKTTEPITIRIDWNNIAGVACSPNLMIKTAMGINVLVASDSPVDWDGTKKKEKGVYQSDFTIPPHLLNANDYYLSIALDSHSPKVCYESHVDVLRVVVWDPMDETSIARGMFVTVREDVVLWPALQCSFKQIKANANTYI
jgi:lipopolysaccharide transport system ATP-binding protein